MTEEGLVQPAGVKLSVTQDSLHAQISFLLGRLKTIVDASLPDGAQNKALKDLVSIEIWGRYNYMLEIWRGKGRLISTGGKDGVDLE